MYQLLLQQQQTIIFIINKYFSGQLFRVLQSIAPTTLGKLRILEKFLATALLSCSEEGIFISRIALLGKAFATSMNTRLTLGCEGPETVTWN